jgi:5-methylcytosine-specific restriction endonuclease McrA
MKGDRIRLIERDGDDTCYLCGEGPRPNDPLTVDHVVPKSRRGSERLDNKRLAHRSCNARKGVG